MEAVTVEEESKTKTIPASRPEPAAQKFKEKPAGPSPRAKILRVAVVAFLILAAAATWYWMHTRYRVSTDDAQVDGHIDYIASRVSGSITEVLVENGTFVKAGQVLVRIDPRDYQAKVDQARAALALAEGTAQAAHEGMNAALAVANRPAKRRSNLDSARASAASALLRAGHRLMPTDAQEDSGSLGAAGLEFRPGQ